MLPLTAHHIHTCELNRDQHCPVQKTGTNKDHRKPSCFPIWFSPPKNRGLSSKSEPIVQNELPNQNAFAACAEESPQRSINTRIECLNVDFDAASQAW